MSSGTPTDSKAPALSGTTIAFLSLSVLMVTSRIYVKLFIVRDFKSDDVMILVTLAFYIAYSTVVFQGIADGNGQHVVNLTPEGFAGAMKMWYIGEIFYSAASTTVRLSVGMLLLNITTIQWHRHLLHFAMIVSTIAGILISSVFLFQCQPIEFFWSTRNPLEGHCIDSTVLTSVLYTHAAVCCFCDWTLALIPWHLVQALHSNRRTKICIGLLLCFANVGCVAAMIRFYAIKLVSVSNDFTYAACDLAIWSGLEVGIAIPAASSVTMRPLYRKFMSKGKPYVEKGDPHQIQHLENGRVEPKGNLDLESKGFSSMGTADSSEIYMTTA